MAERNVNVQKRIKEWNTITSGGEEDNVDNDDNQGEKDSSKEKHKVDGDKRNQAESASGETDNDTEDRPLPVDDTNESEESTRKSSFDSGLKFDEISENLKITWKDVTDAEKYTILAIRESSEEVIKTSSQLPEHVLKANVYHLKTGECIKVSITAHDNREKTTTICDNISYVIGGTTVPSNVTLGFDPNISHNPLRLTWRKAKSNPTAYEVKVYETKKNDEKILKTFETFNNTALIDNLNSWTEYYCVVVAKYPQVNGKPVKSNVLKTTELSSDVYKTKEVWAGKDPLNPSRQVIVKWQAPGKTWKELAIFHYKVFLVNEEKKKTKTQKISGKYETCFHDLKSNTTYKACVETVAMSQNKQVLSNVVKTDPAMRMHGFDIQTKGKPVISMCKAQYAYGDITGLLEWTLPELEVEKNNYKILSVKAFVETEGQQKQTLDVEKQKCKPIALKWGRSYTFTVQLYYLEFDTEKQIEAVATECLNTGVENLSIGDVNWQEKNIKINWSKSKGAIRYILKILNAEGQLISQLPELSNQSKTFPMTDYCAYGNTCEFIVEAIGKNSEKAIASKKLLIGGNSVTTDVVAKSERRQVTVTWKPPKQTPKGFKLILYEVWGPNLRRVKLHDEITPLEHTVIWYCFTELKSDTHFRCEVQPIYQSGPGYGTSSNIEKTPPRIESVQEKKVDFGKPENIRHDTMSLKKDSSSVTISWSTVQLGENYVVIRYDVLLEQIGRLYNSTTLKTNLQPQETQIEAQDLDTGYEYEFKLFTIYKDLDDFNEKQAEAKYKFLITPSQTSINDCTWNEGIICFTWQTVTGATKYCLTIKDEFLNKELVSWRSNNVSKDGEGCEAQIPMSEELGIGRTCMTKVTVYAANTSCETDWKPHLIGGNMVARLVTASRNTKNPKRSLTITFDSPKNGPSKEYKVVAIPESGQRKIQHTGSSPFVFEYLRRGVSYYFEVCAKCDEYWSTPSRSNSIATEGISKDSRSLIDVKKMVHSTVDLRGATLQGGTSKLDVLKGDDFGKVRDLTSAITEDLNKDLVKLQWKSPSFGQNSFDYKIETFEVKVRKPNSEEGMTYFVNFDKTKMEYSTEKYDLELGESYTVSVSTIYEDIDQGVYFISSATKRLITSRPCQPSIVKNDYINDVLTVEWSGVKGAQKYEVELYRGSSTQPYTKELSETKFTRAFDETFGFGITYYCVVKAFGAENKFNQANTARKTIGGDYVPTNVSATINHPGVKDQNTQVRLSWTSSHLTPVKYDIKSLPVARDMTVINLEKEVCLVSGLKAGTDYYFKVSAIYLDEDNKEIICGGCFSNKIQTNPTPTQVKNVHVRLGDNRSTSVDVSWEKVNAEKDNETTIYKVCIEKQDGSAKQQVTVNAESTTFHGLEPDTSYVVTVAGGNSIGFGRQSEQATFKTDLGTPKSVTLQHNATNPSTSLVVTFFHADGAILKYLGTLYKFSNQISHQIGDAKSVESGNEFSDLEPNSEYRVEVQAVAKTEKLGTSVSSRRVMTAPSKPVITEYGCFKEDGELSSRKIFVKWNSNLRCHYHEVSIILKNKHLENKLFVENENEVTYTCQHEATMYSLQIRSRNTSGLFGEFSDRKSITLAPAKIKGAHAELIENGYDIKVQCLKAQHHSPIYFMNAYCEDELVTKAPLVQDSQDVPEDKIEWIFAPKNFGKRYTFELWGEDSQKVKGRRTFTAQITSRLRRGEVLIVKPLESSSSTDIYISWKKQQLCDAYEISARIKGSNNAEIQFRLSNTSCTYRCLNPGETYLVSVRAFCGSVGGFWSEEKSVTLAPADIQLIEDQTKFGEPVRSVDIEWKALGIKPEGYLVKLFCDDVEVDKKKTESTKHMFEKYFTPGSLCYCTVAAYNSDHVGRATRSRTYKIQWAMPEHFQIDLDETEPTRKAEMKWDCPVGVTEFKLEIKNNQTGVKNTSFLSTTRYVFKSGVPSNTYSVKLFSGCDGRYDRHCHHSTMTMGPEPPTEIKVTANKNAKGLKIDVKDNVSTRKSYEVCAEPFTTPEKKISETIEDQSLILCNLVPGEGYKVSVNTVIASVKSKVKSTNEYISTLPDIVKNLRSKLHDGSVVFKWDPLNIQPEEYVVQWRVDDQPICEQRTQKTNFTITRAKPAHWYYASVMASNHSGCGPMTPWAIFMSDPEPPADIKVTANKRVNGLTIEFKDRISAQKSYEVCVEPFTTPEDKIQRTTEELNLTLRDLVPGEGYKVSVNTVFASARSKVVSTNGYVSTLPDVVQNLRSKLENGSVVFEWNPLTIQPAEYIVQWTVNSQPISENRTQLSSFSISPVKPAHWYHASVRACNHSGCGPMTPWMAFISDPLPPTAVTVCKNKDTPETSLIVKFQDETDPLKSYRVVALAGGKEVKDETTKDHFALLTDLTPGQAYHITVQTLFCGRISTKAAYSKY